MTEESEIEITLELATDAPSIVVVGSENVWEAIADRLERNASEIRAVLKTVHEPPPSESEASGRTTTATISAEDTFNDAGIGDGAWLSVAFHIIGKASFEQVCEATVAMHPDNSLVTKASLLDGVTGDSDGIGFFDPSQIHGDLTTADYCFTADFCFTADYCSTASLTVIMNRCRTSR